MTTITNNNESLGMNTKQTFRFVLSIEGAPGVDKVTYGTDSFEDFVKMRTILWYEMDTIPMMDVPI